MLNKCIIYSLHTIHYQMVRCVDEGFMILLGEEQIGTGADRKRKWSFRGVLLGCSWGRW